jgi:hypothetical protein
MEVQDADQYLGGKKGRVYQRGHYQYVLCQSCNKLTGSRYGQEFVSWSRWGLTVLEKIKADSPDPIPAHEGIPLRIAKQVISTMIAASGGDLTNARPDLRAFVLEPRMTLNPDQLRLTTYLCPTSGRSTGVAVVMKQGAQPHHLVEFALPPFGYVLTLSGEPHDSRPVDISWFAACGYNEQRSIFLPHIPILPTHEAFPGDYRTRNEIRRDSIKNILVEEEHPAPDEEAKRIIAAGDGPGFLAAHGEKW